MDESCPSQNGLTQPHIHYSFLKTASEGLLLSQDDFSSNAYDSLDCDSEILAREKQYQLELQQRICNSEELLNQSYYELEEDSLEEDSLEENPLSEAEGSEVEKAQSPTGSHCGKEKCRNSPSIKLQEAENGKTSQISNWAKVSQEETTDRYSELRYNPNWKKEWKSIMVELENSYAEDVPASPSPSLHLSCSPSKDRLTATDCHLKEGWQDNPSVSDRESLDRCVTPASKGTYPSPKHWEQEEEAADASQYNCCSSIYSSASTTQAKDCGQQRSKKDFIGKNKVTLGLAAHRNTSYLQLHNKKQREGHPGQAHQSRRPEMRGTDPSHGASSKESSIQFPVGAQVELRRQQGKHHNELEFEKIPATSSTSREVHNLEQDSRSCGLYPNPPVTLLLPAVASGTPETIQFCAGPIYCVHQDGKETSMNLTFARNPLVPNSYPNFPVFHLPYTVENNQKVHQNTENSSGYQQRSPPRCAFSEPCSLPGHDKHQKPLGDQKISSAYDPRLQQPVNKGLSTWNSRSISSEDICSSYGCGGPGPLQPPAHDLIGALSPTEWLIQEAERHDQEICQLADDYLASMLPPIMQRGDSDSRLNLESSRESPPCLSRSNSESYLLQRGKQGEKKEKDNRKVSRTKGYITMDMKLGGLGPDYESIKDKAEKAKQQKEYAKQIKEHNMKNIISARKPLPRHENKLLVARQKALKYAKGIPKPKIVLSKPLEQEAKDEKVLARTLNGENLPPISSLESLQNRHEREKQIVAAFKTFHIV